MKRMLSLVLVASMAVVLLSQDVGAIPTFARKYRTSCNTCHVAVPKMTAFGENFRLNGFQVPEGDAAYVKEEPVDMGAPAWKKVWPEAVWPGAIPGMGPLSFRAMLDFKTQENTSTKFDFPHEVELFWAGTLGENVPFFAEVEIEGSEVGAEAWLGFYNLLSNYLPERALNLKVGTIDMNLMPVANQHLRLGKNYHLHGNWTLPSSDNTFRLRDMTPGFEANGIVASRFWYAAGLVQGDDTRDKDFYTVARFKFGGTPYDRSAPTEGGAEEAITGKASGFWVDDAFEIVCSAYIGETKIGRNEKDEFYRLGVGGRWTWQNLDISGGIIFGDNDDPYGLSSTKGVDSRASFIEGDYLIFPWLIAALRYESLDIDRPSDFTVSDIDKSRWVPALICQIRPNVKLVTEAFIYTKYDQGVKDEQNIFESRLDYSF